MKQTRMKSFVEQSERHYVSVPRHHLWSRIYIILRVSVFHICRVYVSVCISVCLRCVHVRVSVYYDTLVSSLSLSLVFSLSFPLTRIPFTLSFLASPITPALFRVPFAPCHIYARTLSFFPPAFLSLPVLLSNRFRVRSPLFDVLRYILDICVFLRDRTRLRGGKLREIERDS